MITDSMMLALSAFDGIAGNLTLTDDRLILNGRRGKAVFTKGPIQTVEISLDEIVSIRRGKMFSAPLSPTGICITTYDGSTYRLSNEYKAMRSRIYSIDEWIGFIDAAIARRQRSDTSSRTDAARSGDQGQIRITKEDLMMDETDRQSVFIEREDLGSRQYRRPYTGADTVYERFRQEPPSGRVHPDSRSTGPGLGITVLGIGVGFIAMIILGWIPILGPILAGFIAGIIPGGGAVRGLIAGFIAGILSAIFFAILISPMIAFIAHLPIIGGLVTGGIGLSILIWGLHDGLLGLIGGAIGGAVRPAK